MKKLKAFDSSYFHGKTHFEDDGTQNYLIFQPIYKYFEIAPTANIILSWKCKALSDETIKPPRPRNVFAPKLSYVGNETRAKFDGSCLTQNKIVFYYQNSKYIHCL